MSQKKTGYREAVGGLFECVCSPK